MPTPYPCHRTSHVAEFNDARRRARLRQTRTGHHWVRFGRTRRALVWLAMWILVPVLYAGSLYWVHDVMPEQARLATTQPQIHSIFDAQRPGKPDTAVIVLVGLGNLDATRTASSLPSFSRVGRVWAVRYDERGIDTKVISDLVTTRTRDHGVTAVVLSGHSMGGVVALEVAEHLYRQATPTVNAVLLDCTPLDLHAVRAQARNAGENLLRWIGWIPGARESRVLRLVVETAARQQRFVDHSTWYPRVRTAQLREVIGEVLHEKILSRRVASNALIESQFKVIVASGAIDNLDALARPRGDKPPPAIVFLRPRLGTADRVVDVDYSERILLDQANGPGTLLVVELHGTGHANTNERPDLYDEAVASRIAPFLRSLNAP